MSSQDIEKRPDLRDFQAALAASEGLSTFLHDAHLADVAEWLLEVEVEERWRVFSALQREDQADLLTFADDPVREDLVSRISVAEFAALVEVLPDDEGADLLGLVEPERADEVLRVVQFDRARGLRQLTAYGEETAGGRMTTDFHAAVADKRVGDVIKEIKADAGPAGDEDIGVFITDEHGRPVGFVSDRDLLTHGIHTEIGEAMEPLPAAVSLDADQEEVAHLIHKYDLGAIPVVDASGVLVGVVTADDAIEVLSEEAEEDIRRFVGTSNQEQTRLPILKRVRGRLPLQGLTVVGGLVTAWILDKFLETGSDSGGDLLRYLPIIIGLAGNVGIQSSTILVRAFATGEVMPDREGAVLASEVLSGFIIGMLCGIATAVIASLMEGGTAADWSFGISVGLAIGVAVTWASFLGCVVPLACRRGGIDPAVVAGPFLITLSDISGAAIFVGVARAFLQAAPL